MAPHIESIDGRVRVSYDEQVCTRCVLPASFPQVNFDESGVCNYCRNVDERLVVDAELIRSTVEDAVHTGRGRDYDALVLYSGGKDSSLALKLAVEAGLRPLAFTLDNGFLSGQVGRNVSNVLDSLGVDHVRFRPPARVMHSLYRASLEYDFDDDTVKYSTGGCGSCISMVLSGALLHAQSHGIPLLVGGWTPGQFTTSPVVGETFLTSVIRRHFEPLGARSESLREAMARWHPDRWTGVGVRLLNPLYAREYTEEDTLALLEPLGWSKPRDTDSCSTNCRINGLLIIDHIRRFGFHPYVYELAHHVRIGVSTRENALARMSNVGIQTQNVDRVAVELGIPSLLRTNEGVHA